MEIRKDEQWVFSDIPLPAIFFEAYLPILSGNAVKVYLYAYWSASKSQSVTEQMLLQRLALAEEELGAAVVELVSKNLLQRDAEPGAFLLTDLKRLEFQRLLAEAGERERSEVGTPENVPEEDKLQLLSALSRTFFAGTMAPAWYRFLESCMSEYRFAPDVVYAMVQEAVNRGKLNGPNYAKAIARSWYEAGVRNATDLNRYLRSYEEFRSLCKRVEDYLKITITPEHETYLHRWSEDYGYDWPVIERALSTVVNIGRANFNYFDKILTHWHEAKLGNLSEIEKYENKVRGSRAKRRNDQHGARSNEVRSISYERDYTEEDLNKLFIPIRSKPEEPEDRHGA